MASLGSLPALQVKTPDNPLDQYSKAVGVQQALQQLKTGGIQQQTAQLGLEQEKRQMADQQKISDLMVKHAGNIDKVIADAPGAGVMPNTILALQQHAIQAKTQVAELVSKQGAIAAQQADLMAGAHDAVDKAPPEQKPLVYKSQLAALAAQHIDTSSMPPEYPGDEPFKMLGAVVQGHKEQVAQAIKEREVAAQELTAKARDKAAGKQPEGENPLGEARVGQLNQLLTQRYQVLNPGQPLFPAFQLPANATQKDFDRVDKMLESQERAKGTQAQQETANAIRQQTSELARQSAEDRHSTAIMKPVVGEDAEGNSILTSVEDARKQGLKNLTTADADLQNKSMAARHWLTLANKQGDTPETMGINQLIDKMDKAGKLGVVASRWNDFMAGKVGAGDPDFTALRAKMGLANTKLMQAHVGSRGGSFMLEHFEDLANAKKMNAETLKAAVGSETNYMQDVAMLPKSKQGGKGYTPPAGAKTAVGPNGHKIVVDGGKWVDAQTGQPIQ